MLVRIAFLTVLAAAIASAGATPIEKATASDSAVDFAAIYAAERNDWAEAHKLAAQSPDATLNKLVFWIETTQSERGSGNFSEIAAFAADNPTWPSQKQIRQRAEAAIDGSTSDAALLAWFNDTNRPTSLPAANRLVAALVATGDTARATAAASAAWAEADAQTVDDEEAFYAAWSSMLTVDDSARRVDRLLWAGRTTAARRLLGRLDSDRRALAEARIALRDGSDSASRLVAAVPPQLRDDPGLVYDQVRWLRRKDDEESAAQLLLTYRVDAVQPDKFWSERQTIARRLLSSGDPATAYRLASEHGYSGGSEYIDSEWLAGWIALRFLNRPDEAAQHFLTMFETATHPASRARGAYWSGRAAAAMGQTEAARLWHKSGAQHGTTFYGQLSAAQIRPNQPLSLPADPEAAPAEVEQFRSQELVHAVRLLAAAGDRDTQRTFLIRLAEINESPGWKDLTASLAHQIDRPDVAVTIARQSLRGGAALVGNGYPVVGVPDGGSLATPVEPSLVYAIIRQESSFDLRAVSAAGAQGLMQLMPATARQVSDKLGLPYSPSSLTTDSGYNISLGRAYIGSMVDRYGGSYVLALAAYNAGPGRVNQWLQTNGDPRLGTETAVDWIELIPFNETRNYVQRCMESLNVYRTRLGGTQLAQSASGIPLQ